MRTWLSLILALAAVLASCASPPPPPPVEANDWQLMKLPGKPSTHYAWSVKDGRAAVGAQSDRSASLWRRRVAPELKHARELRFSWWVQDVIPTADLSDANLGDAPARVLLGFDGDTASLPLRTRLLFDLAKTLTGEEPPYATLMYVWDTKLPVGTVLTDARSDRVRKIVVDSGVAELRRWRDHRRDVAADFRLAFGEEPGPLLTMALMTDSDNTRSHARAWYGAVELR